ncbi:hypothetical protein EG68_10639 [Paragonimus skrjabini miyazakii]|uniref:Uncharacterized protein n=1 Tax=Paragonimus skrjabini miyazakii TaxID=59628 RepID=A0A8S9YF11_9TREM|nr:hypothetical protein EG68_10639 [Paragonimus skrjabini miyazakii]
MAPAFWMLISLLLIASATGQNETIPTSSANMSGKSEIE